MPFDRPTLDELITRTQADIKSRLSITGAIVRRSAADIISNATAGAAHLLYGFLDFLALQLFADTAEREFLLRMAEFWGITPIPATFAGGTATGTGVNGSVIPAGTILVRDDENGDEFQVIVGGVIAGGTVVVTVQALLAGADGNTEPGPHLELKSPIAGVNTQLAVNPGGLFGGADEETTEQTRARFKLRLSGAIAGGSDDDYERWSLEVAGVTRAWVFANTPLLGQVTNLFVRDGDVPIFPDAGEIAAVQAKLESERPTTAEVIADGPIDLPTAFTIELLPDSPETRAAVEASIADLYKREAQPGDGLGLGKITLNKIRTAIGNGVGTGDYILTAPVADIVPAFAELPTVGVFTWV